MKLARFVFAFGFLIAACSKEEDKTTLNDYDKYFIQQAAYANLAEINTGSIAATHGNSDSVISFAHMMVSDHTQAEAGLDSLSASLNLQLPVTPDSAHQAMAIQLNTLYGYVFDTTYTGSQIRDHMNTVLLSNSEVALGNNQQLINYVNKYLPLIQMHLQEAQTIQGSLH